MSRSLRSILSPNSIAVIGASANPAKRGHQAIRQLLQDQFPGPIYPINPNLKEVMGLKSYASVLDVPDSIDMALVCTPAKSLPNIINDCGAKGISGIVALAAGFVEVGGEGAVLSKECLEKARVNNVRIIGPNSNGMFNLHHRMNLVGVKGMQPGEIGVVSQSGNLLVAFMTEANWRGGVGFSTYAGVGNQLDVQFHEYLEYFENDDKTKVPIFYVEGFRKGRQFLKACRNVSQKKPIVIYKSGRTEAGQNAAISHTGALAGQFNLTRDLLRQAGATVVEQSAMILSIAEGLGKLPTARGDRIAVLADGGGHATIVTDSLIEHGLTLASFSENSLKRLREILPQQATLQNPIDVAGATDFDPAPFANCSQVLLEDENIDIVLIVGMFGGYAHRFTKNLLDAEIESSIRLGKLAKEFGKPLLVQSVYGALRTEPIDVLKDSGVPVFIWPETAVQCIAEVVRYSKRKEMIAKFPLVRPSSPANLAASIVKHALSEKRDSLFEYEARNLLRAYGVVVPPHLIVRNSDELRHVQREFGSQPIAMKIISQDILHKTDAGGVRLEVSGEPALKSSYEEILQYVNSYSPLARVKGVLVSPMAESGVKLIIGVTHDPIFGSVLMFGIGDVLVEVSNDVAFRALPMSEADAYEVIDDIRSRKILEGVRGIPPVDKTTLANLILLVSKIALSHPEISEIDLNPVIVRGDEYDVVDARMILKPIEKNIKVSAP